MMLYFGSPAFLMVALAAAGLFTAPIWVLLTSIGWFGERLHLTPDVGTSIVSVFQPKRPIYSSGIVFFRLAQDI